MKAYTDINQSRKLAEILPLESADMCYYHHIKGGADTYCCTPELADDILPDELPCWSLAALLQAMPKILIANDKTYSLMLSIGYVTSMCYVNIRDTEDCLHGVVRDSCKVMDVVFDMIIWLKENKYI